MPATIKERAKIDVRQAATAAGQYLLSLYPGVSSYSLEEVELSEDENFWIITLSFDGGAKISALGILQPPLTKFKSFKVDARTGKVVSIKIRQIE